MKTSDCIAMAVGIFLMAVLLPTLSWDSISWSEEQGVRHIQYSERSGRVEEAVIGAYGRDWYEDAYDDYEESPYGYYDEDAFYDDFDLNYWDRDSEGDWYENKYRQYGRGYLDRGR